MLPLSRTGRLELEALKLAQLKTVCALTGNHVTGTKPNIIQSLPPQLRTPRFHGKDTYKILSLDMGIRNLAYCTLDISEAQVAQAAHGPQADGLFGDMHNEAPSITRLLKWNRVGLFDNAASPLQTPLPAGGAEEDLSRKEVFDPPHMAPLAYDFVANVLLCESPDLILIERQRHRSGGSPAIFEWTMRVNMLEAMLWAILTALGKHSGPVKGLGPHPLLHAVSPKMAGTFWTADQSQWTSVKTSAGRKPARSAMEKEAKIAVAERWLRQGVRTDGQATGMSSAFLAARRPKGGEKGLPKPALPVPKLSKLDDLADCLLQGMAWVQWEINRRRILAMLDLEQDKV